MRRRLLKRPHLGKHAHRVLADWSHSMGNAWVRAGVHMQAERCYATAAREYSLAGERHDATRCELNRATCLLELGHIRDAEALFREVLPKCAQRGDVLSVASHRLAHANTLRDLGRHGEARELLDMAFPVLRRLAPPLTYADYLVQSAGRLHGVGRAAEALPFYTSAATIVARQGTPLHRARLKLSYAATLLSTGENEGALCCLRAAGEILNSDEAGVSRAPYLVRLGHMLVELKQYEEARSQYERALPVLTSIGDQFELANCHLGMGTCMGRMGRMGRAADAEQSYVRALGLCRAAGSVADELRATVASSLAWLRYRAGDVAGAEDALSEALQVMESRPAVTRRVDDRTALRGTYEDTYQLAVLVAWKRRRVILAFDRVQRAKSRVLGELLAVRTSGLPAGHADRLPPEAVAQAVIGLDQKKALCHGERAPLAPAVGASVRAADGE